MRLREGLTLEGFSRITGSKKETIGPFSGPVQRRGTRHSNPNFFNR